MTLGRLVRYAPIALGLGCLVGILWLADTAGADEPVAETTVTIALDNLESDTSQIITDAENTNSSDQKVSQQESGELSVSSSAAEDDPTISIADSSSTLYAGSTTGQLFSINITTGAQTPIGSPGNPIHAMAYDRNTDRIYVGRDVTPGQLSLINPDTGVQTLIGTGTFRIDALAFDPNTNTLYGGAADQLFSINTSTAFQTNIGACAGCNDIAGMAFDPNTNTLWGGSNDSRTGQIFRINTATGGQTNVGNPSGNTIDALEFDSTTNTLYMGGCNGNVGQLFVVNTSTGVQTPLGSAGSNRICGLAFRSTQSGGQPTPSPGDTSQPSTSLTSTGTEEELPSTGPTAWLPFMFFFGLALIVLGGFLIQYEAAWQF